MICGVAEDTSSMSECRNVNFVVLTSSVNWVRKPTFFGLGNIGRDCENDIRLLLVRGSGPFTRIDVVLKERLYGAPDSVESTVETDASGDAVKLNVSADSGRGIWEGVDGSTMLVNLVASGVSVGFLCRRLGVRSPVARFLNVFLAVGDVADKVSSLKLVVPLSTFDVFSDSLGRLAGEGKADIASYAGYEP